MSGSKILMALIALALTSYTFVSPADAQRRDGANDAREQMRAGQIKSRKEIESIVIPRMRGMKYLGPEFDAAASVYRLKFLDDNRVIYVDVDARTGRILRQTGG